MIHSYDGKTPQIHESAFIHPDSTIIGDATVGADSSIWSGTIIRADMGRIVIGARSSIQDGSICHLTENFSETIVGDQVTVGHRVILHGCIIEDTCLIGMGAILLDNSHIGTGSLIGAGALVTVGMEIPPHSLVMGSPAKVVGPLKEKNQALVELSWQTYVEHAAQYRRELG
jgi:carbonic anhydrase/acetyltransferase-like protein (isoleucine patch superfamily)